MVYGFYNWVDKIKRYAPYVDSEWKWFFIAWPLLTLVMAFDDGSETFRITNWIGNYIISGLGIALAIFVSEFAERAIALEQGFKLTTKPFLYGILGGLIISIMTNGKVIFLAHRSFHMDTIESQRLGYFRYHRSYYAMGKIAFLGPFANILVAILLFYIPILPNPARDVFISANIIYAISNMLPIPPLDGSLFMYASRLMYFFVFGAYLGIVLVIEFGASIWIMFAAALIMGILLAKIYFGVVEPKIGGSYGGGGGGHH